GAGVVGGSDAQERHAAGGAQVLEVDLLAAGHGHDGARPGLGEERGGEVDAVALAQAGEVDAGADAEAQAGVDERLHEPTCGQVVGGLDDLVARGVDEHRGEAALGGEVDGGRPAPEVAVDDVGPDRAGQLLRRRAEEVDGAAGRDPAGAGGAGDVVDHAQDADDGGRVDRRVDPPRRTGAVVQGDVPAGDGHAELGARVGQAGDRLDELPHGVRVLGGAEVQAVGDGGGLGADRRDVPDRK